MVSRGRLWTLGAAAIAGVVGVVGIGVLAGARFLPAGGSGAGDVPVLRVEAQPFAHRVPAEGNLRASVATPIGVPSNVEGPLRIAWLAADGAAVKAGEPVLRFDATDMEKSLRDAQDDLAKAGSKSAKEKAQGVAETAKMAGDLRVAQLEVEGAARFLKKDPTIFSKNERIESELDGELAQARSQHADEAEKVRRRLSRADLQLLAIEAEQAKFKIDTAHQGLASLAVAAPHDGILVLRRDYRGNPPRVGDSVWQGQPLAEIPDLAKMEAEVFVLEADAGGLAVGKTATVELESAPGLPYRATIARVDSLAKPRLRGSPVQYFAVVLHLAATDPARMKPGARVRAVLDLASLPAALAVPRQAVFERDGKPVVYLRASRDRRDAREPRSAGGFQAVPVTLGPSGMGRVVIAAGLQAGDTIALADPSRRPEDAAAKAAGKPSSTSPVALPKGGGGAR